MRNTIKAVLLSALVFPGAGHFSLKKPIHGSVLLGITVVCLYFLFSAIFDISNELSGKILSGEIPYDTNKVTELVTEKVSTGDYQFVSISMLVLIACWIFAVVDSFRIGRIQDRNSANQKSF